MIFINPASVAGQGNGQSEMSGRDKAFNVGNIQANGSGTQLTVTVTVTDAAPDPRLVVVGTQAGISSMAQSTVNGLTVVP